MLKVSETVNYPIQDVFNVFIKAAKRDFQGFDRKNPIGCKREKVFDVGRKKKVICSIEITDFVENEKYEITTKNDISTCKSVYRFEPKDENKTLITFEESQGALSLTNTLMIYVQRLFVAKKSKEKFKLIIRGLENEIKTYMENIERSMPKNKEA